MNYAKAWRSKLNTLHFLYVNLNYIDVYGFIFLIVTKRPDSAQAPQFCKKTFLDRIWVLLAELLSMTFWMWWFIYLFFAQFWSVKALSSAGVELIHRKSCVCCRRVGGWRFNGKFLNSPDYGGKKINIKINCTSKRGCTWTSLKNRSPQRLSDIIIMLLFGTAWVFRQNIDVGFSISPLDSLPI